MAHGFQVRSKILFYSLKKAARSTIVKIIYCILPSEIMKDQRFFCLWEKKGFHVTPVHFYSPIPEICSLPENIWKRESQLIGVDLNESAQIELLSVFRRFKAEYDLFPIDKSSNPLQYYIHNGMLISVDGEVLYSMIRYYKPKRIIEVGSGYSTLLSAQAILNNKQEDPNYDCQLIAIEPYPNDLLKKGFPGLSKLVTKKVQEASLSEFESLEEGDILFIDSSHVLKIGSDVQFLYLELIPRLKKGVIIHCHDIFLPAEYPKEWAIEEGRFWSEQYLLQAFLAFNESFQVLWAGHFMHLHHPELLEKSFSSYNRMSPSFPGSFWLQKIK